MVTHYVNHIEDNVSLCPLRIHISMRNVGKLFTKKRNSNIIKSHICFQIFVSKIRKPLNFPFSNIKLTSNSNVNSYKLLIIHISPIEQTELALMTIIFLETKHNTPACCTSYTFQCRPTAAHFVTRVTDKPLFPLVFNFLCLRTSKPLQPNIKRHPNIFFYWNKVIRCFFMKSISLKFAIVSCIELLPSRKLLSFSYSSALRNAASFAKRKSIKYFTCSLGCNSFYDPSCFIRLLRLKEL